MSSECKKEMYSDNFPKHNTTVHKGKGKVINIVDPSQKRLSCTTCHVSFLLYRTIKFTLGQLAKPKLFKLYIESQCIVFIEDYLHMNSGLSNYLYFHITMQFYKKFRANLKRTSIVLFCNK